MEIKTQIDFDKPATVYIVYNVKTSLSAVQCTIIYKKNFILK